MSLRFAFMSVLSDLSVKKKKSFLQPKHPRSTAWWFTVLVVVWWNINPLTLPPFLLFFLSSEIQTESSGVHPSPERTGNFVTDQSHRVSHCRIVRSLCSVECPGPGYIRFRGKSLTFQTPGDIDTNHHHHHHHHHHPPFISGAPA